MTKKIKISMSGQILIAMILGIIIGLTFKSFSSNLKIIGDIFIKLIQMGIILLVMGQVIEAVGNINLSQFGRMIRQTIIVFFTSSILAALWGVLMVILFKPGIGISINGLSNNNIKANQSMSFSKVIADFFPSNIFESMSKGSIVQVIVFSIIFGIALSAFCHSTNEFQLLDILKQFNQVILKMISLIMKIAPVGIFALIASAIGKLGIKVVVPMIKYLLVYGFATLTYLIFWILCITIVTKLNFLNLIKNMWNMSLMALATTSSAVTFPTELEDAKEKLGIKDKIAQIVLSLGMSLNSNGSAMHMSITIITIAQIYGIHYNVQTYMYIVLLATLASLANAVVPGAALVSLAIVIPQMGLPVESIALFAGVDWFVGMLRTILNVDSDVFSSILVAHKNDGIDTRVFYNNN
ncbi:dicarboxylate/amino acid:cation symporter [Companilactobacillus insicii]|uniref:dicarboxylate/amino acid:cation symporter n=1 Tax=Companilactobacillus insicii TaxID=1732567 RepID=UPI000F7814CD|nr:dicarboxylate/amino acid:cation symporter [Companilactobacillus insicii]